MTTTADEPRVAPEGTPEDKDAIRERGRELELQTKRGLHTGQPAYTDFQPQMRNLIKDALLPAEATDTELYYLLEMAATYRLDPFAREIWAVRMPGRNAAGRANVTIMVGRDGMLAIAERHDGYRGSVARAVYENDEFKFESDPRKMPDGSFSHVTHSFDVTSHRGALLGAWAEVYREGRPTTFFWAPIEEYDKSDSDYSPWKKQKTVMIEKCALVTALRTTFRISGLYIADEMSNAILAPKAEVEKVESGETNWGDNEEIRFRLGDLFSVLEYPPAKQRITLAGMATDEERRELIDFLEKQCEERSVPVPAARTLHPDDEFVPDEAVEVIVDPEVVDPDLDDSIEF